MQRKRGELVPIGEVVADLPGHVKAIREATPQALHHYTRFDQVNPACLGQRSGPGARLHGAAAGVVQLAAKQPRQPPSVCSLQRPLYALHDGGWRQQLPFGSLPRLLLAWLSTEAVRTLGIYNSGGQPQPASATRWTGSFMPVSS